MKNAVILNKDASTWPRIKKYWEAKGVDMYAQTITEGWIGWYYGFIDGKFDGYQIGRVKDSNAEIIELPEEPVEWKFTSVEFLADQASSKNEQSDNPKTYKQGFIDGYNTKDNEANVKEEKKYPRVMWVWDDEHKRKWKRVVVCEYNGNFVSSGAETIKEFCEANEKLLFWDNATEIEEVSEIEVTIEEIAAWKGVSVEQVKIKK